LLHAPAYWLLNTVRRWLAAQRHLHMLHLLKIGG
jgi:hypothetical protein